MARMNRGSLYIIMRGLDKRYSTFAVFADIRPGHSLNNNNEPVREGKAAKYLKQRTHIGSSTLNGKS
jgi:hypothetical protein